MPLERRAHAKVNLALAVGPPGSGGMHPIASWMHAIDLHDTVTLERLPDGDTVRFNTTWSADAPRPTPIDWPREKDLAFRAHALLEKTVARPLPVAIRVQKRIPVGGGLGGGSSDAAAVLTGLRDLFDLPLTNAELARLSATLGSDIAFFIDAAPTVAIGGTGVPPVRAEPQPALVRGLGDDIQRLPRPLAGRPIILIIPSFACATGAVYSMYDRLGPRQLRDADVAAIAAAADTTALFNDLFPAAEQVQPALALLRTAAERAAGAPVHMSGSGSTLFVLPQEHDAAPIANKIARELSDISVLATRLV